MCWLSKFETNFKPSVWPHSLPLRSFSGHVEFGCLEHESRSGNLRNLGWF